jgi:DnaJ-class molecular chaperone
MMMKVMMMMCMMQVMMMMMMIHTGWKDGTKITFEGEGDESAGVLPADIVFVVKTKPHDRFTREGDHLLYEV